MIGPNKNVDIPSTLEYMIYDIYIYINISICNSIYIYIIIIECNIINKNKYIYINNIIYIINAKKYIKYIIYEI